MRISKVAFFVLFVLAVIGAITVYELGKPYVRAFVQGEPIWSMLRGSYEGSDLRSSRNPEDVFDLKETQFGSDRRERKRIRKSGDFDYDSAEWGSGIKQKRRDQNSRYDDPRYDDTSDRRN
jgi:hypothetical protein